MKVLVTLLPYRGVRWKVAVTPCGPDETVVELKFDMGTRVGVEGLVA